MPQYQNRVDGTQILRAFMPFEPTHAHGDIKIFNSKGKLKKTVSAKKALMKSYEHGADFSTSTPKNLKKKPV